jgi:hypothetical protein
MTTPLYAKWSRRGAVEAVIYDLNGAAFTAKDLKHAIITSEDKLLANLNTDELHLAVRDTIRGMRAAGRIVVQKTASRGGGYLYSCTQLLPAAQRLSIDKMVAHYGHEINRRAAVEQEIWNAVNGRTPLPDVEQLRKWALRLGVPECECFKGTNV